MGHIPGFTKTIFPTASLPSFSVVANLGLILLLFLEGLETDLRFLISNWRVSLSVSAAGIILPFGLGYVISYGLYNQFHDDPETVYVEFGTFLPSSLLGTQVGVMLLSAGVGNDVVGWILQALCVALVNAGSRITALYVLLVAAAYLPFLPHEGGFAIKLTEKIEGLVAALFLPLYFILSGLSTSLGLLDRGTVSGYVLGIIGMASTAKVIGCAIASRFCGIV
ncbi:hypothetical protein N7486_008894 [Penicillium sp. IBT 16267x]|nr:hypothetical protein N7486_008894 [Penicillium sp. IBT 16267x]